MYDNYYTTPLHQELIVYRLFGRLPYELRSAIYKRNDG